MAAASSPPSAAPCRQTPAPRSTSTSSRCRRRAAAPGSVDGTAAAAPPSAAPLAAASSPCSTTLSAAPTMASCGRSASAQSRRARSSQPRHRARGRGPSRPAKAATAAQCAARSAAALDEEGGSEHSRSTQRSRSAHGALEHHAVARVLLQLLHLHRAVRRQPHVVRAALRLILAEDAIRHRRVRVGRQRARRRARSAAGSREFPAPARRARSSRRRRRSAARSATGGCRRRRQHEHPADDRQARALAAKIDGAVDFRSDSPARPPRASMTPGVAAPRSTIRWPVSALYRRAGALSGTTSSTCVRISRRMSAELATRRSASPQPRDALASMSAVPRQEHGLRQRTARPRSVEVRQSLESCRRPRRRHLRLASSSPCSRSSPSANPLGRRPPRLVGRRGAAAAVSMSGVTRNAGMGKPRRTLLPRDRAAAQRVPRGEPGREDHLARHRRHDDAGAAAHPRGPTGASRWAPPTATRPRAENGVAPLREKIAPSQSTTRSRPTRSSPPTARSATSGGDDVRPGVTSACRPVAACTSTRR